MDVIDKASQNGLGRIECIDMHTIGMPARIVIKGFPNVQGTLIEQKEQAEQLHDRIRKRFLLEPRGHIDMFGAILRPDTELTRTGEAHMGVLFAHGSGYGFMCGHGTIALGRLLVDTHDLTVFPRRNQIPYNEHTKTSQVTLHTPVGLVHVTVPSTDNGARSDPSRPVSFVAVPAYALATNLKIDIPSEYKWPELGSRDSVHVSIAKCGATAAKVLVEDLGFPADCLTKKSLDLQALKFAANRLRAAVNNNPRMQEHLTLKGSLAPTSLYAVSITDQTRGTPRSGSKGAELCQYFFGGNHTDRSPTGSFAGARIALQYAKGLIHPGDSWTYHCPLSFATGADGITATLLEAPPLLSVGEAGYSAGPCKVQLEGSAFYTGSHTFVLEKADTVCMEGFIYGEF